MYIRPISIIFILVAFISVKCTASNETTIHRQEEKTMLFENYQLIDLSHPLNSDVPTWDGSCGFHLKMKCDYGDCPSETKFRIHRVEMNAGIGTHIDAPHHCFPEGASIDQLPLLHLMVPAVVINVADKADANYQLSAEDIKDFETKHGIIPPHHLAIIYTGWSNYWHDMERYRNLDSQGLMCFPSISAEAAQYLIDRQAVGIAIDTLSPDIPSSDYPVHRLILGSGKYIIENVANADQLPPYGTYIIALPLKIAGGTEAPIRMIGMVPFI